MWEEMFHIVAAEPVAWADRFARLLDTTELELYPEVVLVVRLRICNAPPLARLVRFRHGEEIVHPRVLSNFIYKYT